MKDRTEFVPLSNQPTRRRVIVGAATVLSGLALVPTQCRAENVNDISHSAESIHQEVVFKATRKRVYEALTDAKQFERIVQLSDAANTLIHPGAPPTLISTEVGGAFSMFGGLIVGRLIELVPNERIVQAWRPAYWEPGTYSVVRFKLKETSGSSTNLVLDHRGFPDGDAKSLLDGWNKNYWVPLARYLD